MVLLPSMVIYSFPSPSLPWNYTGFQRFPSFYFGGNEAGPQSANELELLGRYSLVGWGWQQSYNLYHGEHGEMNGANAAAALRSLYPVSPGNASSPDALFVYRQSESLFTYYDLMGQIASNATEKNLSVVKDPVTGAQCGGGGLLGFSEYFFQQYWSRTVGNEINNESFVNAVFLDGFDKLYAGNTLQSQGCPNFNSSSTAAELIQKVTAQGEQLQILSEAKKVAIISTYNFLANASHFLNTLTKEEKEEYDTHRRNSNGFIYGDTDMNGVTEDVYVAAWSGEGKNVNSSTKGQWIRFYEVWMGHGYVQDSIILRNAILEGQKGIPFIARSQIGTVKTLEYPAAAFLIAQGPYCYWGASSGWVDPDWSWKGEYDWDVGAPLGPAVEVNTFVWTRSFTKANVTVDLKTARGKILSV